MTATPQRRPALEIVPDPEPGPDLSAPTVIDHWDAEHQLIGSLMWLSPAAAQPLVKLVPTNAIWRPQARWAYELICRAIAAGAAPTPPGVLAAGRRHAAADAVNPQQVPSPTQHHQLALYLFEAYSQAVAPTVAADTYAREVLAEAYRRAFQACGIRMQQLAAGGADRATLTAEFGGIRDELADLWRRTEAAAG